MLLLGDCVEVLKTLPDNSVDSVVTDPPYGLEFMGKEWDKLGADVISDPADVGGFQDGNGGNPYSRSRIRYGITAQSMQAWHLEWAREVLRVLKPGGHLLAFGGTRTYHRMACAIEDAGFEIRDQMQWIYASGFPKSYNIGKNCEGWDGWGSALKPANEPICVARKPLSEKSIVENVLRWGVGGLNIDKCRVELEEGQTKDKGNPNRIGNKSGVTAFDTSSSYNPSQGRFPANIIFDEEAGRMLDEMSGELKTGAMNGSYVGYRSNGYVGGDDGNKIQLRVEANKGGASRFFYCAKSSRSERNAGLEGMETTRPGLNFGGALSGSGKPINISPQTNSHPTVKPISLMRYLCRLVTPPKGTVLDPFMGSGTTGCAASLEGFEFIGIEREAEYMEIAERRIAHYRKQIPIPF